MRIVPMPRAEHPAPEFSHIKIVLVEPESPGNIGAVTRAMDNFGFSRLCLVNPCDYKVPHAYWLSRHAEDILEQAEVTGSLQSALEGVHIAVATTNRRRFTHNPSFTPKEVAARIRDTGAESSIALVFGRESDGLTNDELHQCQLLSTVPVHPGNMSLNLAQAVMVYLYEIFQHHLDGNPHFDWRLADPREIEQLYRRIEIILNLTGFVPRKTMERFILRIRRLFGRTPMEERDVRLLHRIFKQIENQLMRKKTSI